MLEEEECYGAIAIFQADPYEVDYEEAVVLSKLDRVHAVSDHQPHLSCEPKGDQKCGQYHQRKDKRNVEDD